MAWFKKEKNELISAEYLSGEGFTLTPTNASEYPQGVGGWHWFDSLDAAISGINAAEQGYREVTAVQARLALKQLGLLDNVNAAISAANGGTAITWEYTTAVRSNDPTLLAMASALGWTDDQLKALFDLAETL